jgi:predicted metal-binding protein
LSEPVVLHVCTTCRTGLEPVEGRPVPGQVMYDAVAAALQAAPDLPVRLHPVACLAACAQGCTATLSAPGKWSMLLGRLDPALAADLIAYAGIYAASRTGTVMPSKRPASLAGIVLGRLPAPLETAA